MFQWGQPVSIQWVCLVLLLSLLRSAVSDGQTLHEEKDVLLQFPSRARGRVAPAPVEPLPPSWPEQFSADFEEVTSLTLFSSTTTGRYFYDASQNRTRVERSNGIGDRYCGSALPFRSTPCTHLVIEGERFLVFPEKKYCCKCCSEAAGCGVVSRDWLALATYEGQDMIYGYKCNKWNKKGILQNTYYWQALDGTPMRIYLEYMNQMTFKHDTYSADLPVDEQLFALPEDMDCSPSCYGYCLIA